jgi:tetratricopeptide (TPR) repeat protein
VASQQGVGDKVETQWALAKRMIAAGSFAKAEPLLVAIVAARPTFGRGWHELGNARYRRKAYLEALEAFQKRLNLEPGDAIANYSLAVALIAVGRSDEGRLYLDRAITINPDFREALEKRRRLAGPQNSPPADLASPSVVPRGQSAGAPDTLSKELQQGRVDPGKVLFEGKPMLRIAVVFPLLLAILLLVFYYVLMLMTGAFRPGVRLFSSMGPVDYLLFGVPPTVILLIFLLGAARVASTHYRILERRIDVSSGIIFRKTDSVWLYEVTDITFNQPLPLLICNTGKIVVHSEKTKHVVFAILSRRQMRRLWETMRDAVVAQRRDIKGIWV